MASSLTPLTRVSLPLARAAVAAVRRPGVRGLAESAVSRLNAGDASTARHPLVPAAVRVERARTRRKGDSSRQTAVTVWFGQGPALPGPNRGDAVRTAVRLGTGIVGAAALAAMTVIAARRDELHGTIVDAAPPQTLR